MDIAIRPHDDRSRQLAAGSSPCAAIANSRRGHERAAVKRLGPGRRVLAGSAALALALVQALYTAPAPALGGPADPEPSEGTLVSELVSSPHPAPGVTAKVLPGHVPGILLDATSTQRTITVLGPAGDPYLRLGPRGVEVNMRSSADSGTGPGNNAQAPASGDVSAAPQWRRIVPEARYAWLESRARFPPDLVPDDVITGGRRRVLLRWEIPLEVDGRRTELRGITSWVPSAASAERGGAGGLFRTFGVPIAVLGALTVAAGVALIVVARRAAGRSRPGRD